MNARLPVKARPPAGVWRRGFRSEVRKLRTAPEFARLYRVQWIIAIVGGVIIGVSAPQINAPSTATVLLLPLIVGGAITVIIAVLAVAGDIEHGTAQLTRLWVGSPVRIQLTRLGLLGAAALLLTAPQGVAAVVIAVVLSRQAPAEHQISFEGWPLVALPLALALLAVVAASVAWVIGTNAGALGVVLGWWLLVENGLLPLIPTFGARVAAYLPLSNAQYAVLGGGIGDFAWSPQVGLAYAWVWGAGIVGISFALVLRREWRAGAAPEVSLAGPVASGPSASGASTSTV